MLLSQADWHVVACLGLHAFVLDINAEADYSTSGERGLSHLLTSHHGICFWCSSFRFVHALQYYKQWRSQECELGASPPLPPCFPPFPLSSPLPFLTGARGYNARKNC